MVGGEIFGVVVVGSPGVVVSGSAVVIVVSGGSVVVVAPSTVVVVEAIVDVVVVVGSVVGVVEVGVGSDVALVVGARVVDVVALPSRFKPGNRVSRVVGPHVSAAASLGRDTMNRPPIRTTTNTNPPTFPTIHLRLHNLEFEGTRK